MKNPIPSKVAKVRRDISSYLFHFVNRNTTPQHTLRSILEQKCIRGGVYTPARSKTVCFTEAPLADIIREDGILDSHNYQRLSLWGIGFKKSYVYAAGGLPVIYQPRARLSDLKNPAIWRHVDFDLNSGLDYTWQREWRVETAEFRFESAEAILVIPSVEAFVEELWEVVIDAENDHGEITYHGGTYKKWDFIPIEHVNVADDTSIETCKGEEFTDIIQEGYYERMDFEGP